MICKYGGIHGESKNEEEEWDILIDLEGSWNKEPHGTDKINKEQEENSEAMSTCQGSGPEPCVVVECWVLEDVKK